MSDTYIPRCGVLASIVAGNRNAADLMRPSQVLVVRPGTPLGDIAPDCRDRAVVPEVVETFGRRALRFVPLAAGLPTGDRWLHSGSYLLSNGVLRAETQRLTGGFTRHHALCDHLRASVDARPVPVF